MKKSSRKPLQCHPAVVFQRLGDEMVLVHLETNKIYALNHTAGRAFELIAARSDPESLLTKLSEEFEVGPEELTLHMDELMGFLMDRDLLVAAETPGQRDRVPR